MSESVVGTDAHDRPLNKADSRVGEVLFGKFKITDLVQNSENASMFAAQDLSNGTHVLIETINTPIPSGLENFARLAKEVLTLQHENILRLITYEELKNRPYFIWEFVDFVRLQDLIEGGGFIEQESEIFDTISQVCRGLQFAHEKGIAHGYLHPSNICLADVNGEICIKIANFGFSHLQHQLRALESSGVILYPKPETDIYQLAVLSYFTATGEAPEPVKSLDEFFNPRSTVPVTFDALPDQRSDMRGYEEFTQLLDDTLDTDEDFRVSTAREFEDGLTDWMESVKASEATRSVAVEKLAEDHEKPLEPLVKKKKKITNNMRTTVRAMVNLKSKQSVQEETAVMKLTNIAAAKGPRQSPMASAIRLSIGLLGCLTVVGIASYAAFVKPEETRELFLNTSQSVASVIGPKKKDEGEILVDPVVVPTISSKSGATEVVRPQPLPLPDKPLTKLPKFDPNVLHDLYRKDFTSSNNQARRAFRIEYREFRPDWISK
jgi:serine/threonine protein kinase